MSKLIQAAGSLTIFACFALVGCAEPKYAPPSAPETPVERAITACDARFQPSGLCLNWSWEVEPTASVTGALIFKIQRLAEGSATAGPVDLQSVPAVVLWMPSMGHGSTPTKVEKIGAGTYRASNVFFIMPGDWEIKFRFQEEGARSEEAVVALIR